MDPADPPGIDTFGTPADLLRLTSLGEDARDRHEMLSFTWAMCRMRRGLAIQSVRSLREVLGLAPVQEERSAAEAALEGKAAMLIVAFCSSNLAFQGIMASTRHCSCQTLRVCAECDPQVNSSLVGQCLNVAQACSGSRFCMSC